MVDGRAPAQDTGSEWTLGKTSLLLAGIGVASMLLAFVTGYGTPFLLAMALFVAALSVGVAATVRARRDPDAGVDKAGVMGISVGAVGLAVALIVILIILILIALFIQLFVCLFSFGFAC